MSIQDLFSMAKKNLLSRKLRTFLTLLGVMIGTTAIIVMMSFGFGIKDSNEKMITSMGDLTIFDVTLGNMDEGKKPLKMNDSTIKEIEKISHVSSVSPIYQQDFALNYKKFENPYVQLVALDPKAIDTYKWEFEKGKLFRDSGEIEVIFGSKVASSFYNPKKPVEPEMDESGNYIEPPAPFDASGTTMELLKSDSEVMGFDASGPVLEAGDSSQDKDKVKTVDVKVVGVLKERKDFNVDYNIFMSIKAYKNLLKEFKMPQPAKNDYASLKVKVDDIKNAREVEKEIKNMGFEVQGLFSMLDQMEKSMGVISAIFGGIGAISFIVAAIGITNTMIMSIYERTREIGVMKVIGASIADIQRLFLVEAGLIGLMGGIIGVIFSFLLSTFFNLLANHFTMQNGAEEAVRISIIPLWLIFVGIIFSTIVGVLAGYFPARRAMNLSALDAIRTE